MKRVIVLLAAVMTLMMCACDGDSGDVKTVSGSDYDDEYIFEQRINERLPIYQFKVTMQLNDNYQSRDYTMSVCDKDTGELIQILRFEAVEPNDYDEYPITLEDVDFDGYLDLIIHVSQGVGSYGMYEVYRWSHAFVNQGFESFLSYGGFDMETFDKTNQLIIYESVMDGDVPEKLYQIERDGDYDEPCIRHLRNMTYAFKDDIIKYAVEELINGEWVVIYEISIAADESLPDECDKLLYNYMHFGVAEPVTVDEALKLVSDKYGKTDDSAKYEFRQLLTIGGKTYYHIERLYKKNESDTGYYSDNCAVAVDGSEIIDCEFYLNELSARFGNNN